MYKEICGVKTHFATPPKIASFLYCINNHIRAFCITDTCNILSEPFKITFDSTQINMKCIIIAQRIHSGKLCEIKLELAPKKIKLKLIYNSKKKLSTIQYRTVGLFKIFSVKYYMEQQERALKQFH